MAHRALSVPTDKCRPSPGTQNGAIVTDLGGRQWTVRLKSRSLGCPTHGAAPSPTPPWSTPPGHHQNHFTETTP